MQKLMIRSESRLKVRGEQSREENKSKRVRKIKRKKNAEEKRENLINESGSGRQFFNT